MQEKPQYRLNNYFQPRKWLDQKKKGPEIIRAFKSERGGV
jgi:hypothetical protein